MRKARKHQLNTDQCKALRQEESMPVIDQIGKWMIKQHKAPEFLPKDLMDKAFTYLLHRFNYITRYLQEIKLNLIQVYNR